MEKTILVLVYHSQSYRHISIISLPIYFFTSLPFERSKAKYVLQIFDCILAERYGVNEEDCLGLIVPFTILYSHIELIKSRKYNSLLCCILEVASGNVFNAIFFQDFEFNLKNYGEETS